MNNEIFLNQMQHIYESLKYFKIEGDKLILNINGVYTIPFTNVQFINLNPNLFLLDPQELFHILYMLELLPKENINDTELKFIEQYVSRYININDQALANNNINQNLVWCLSIPIYSSYDPDCINKPCSIVIQNVINNHSNEIENSKGKHPRLVLTNPNFSSNLEEDNLTNLEKAGFTTILLIVSAVALTCFYLAYVITGA